MDAESKLRSLRDEASLEDLAFAQEVEKFLDGKSVRQMECIAGAISKQLVAQAPLHHLEWLMHVLAQAVCITAKAKEIAGAKPADEAAFELGDTLRSHIRQECVETLSEMTQKLFSSVEGQQILNACVRGLKREAAMMDLEDFLMSMVGGKRSEEHRS